MRLGVELGEIIAAGILKAPLALFCTYKGRQLSATLRPDGSVDFDGTAYESCSQAAETARGTAPGRRMNTNGWSFWRYDDRGAARQLTHARGAFLAAR